MSVAVRGHANRGRSSVAAVLSALLLLPPGQGESRRSDPPFVDAAAELGLRFTHANGATGEYYMAEQMGAGVALFDYDGDGDLDVFFVQGGALAPDAARGGQAPAGRLFRNDLATGAGGRRKLGFTDVTDRAGLSRRGYGMGAAVGDYDNDGDLDLYVTAFGANALFRNGGDGTFTDVTAAAGVGAGDTLWGTGAAFLDFDRDGHLDLFVANYVDFALTANRRCVDAVGARDYCSPRMYRPVPDRLYRNLGDGTFQDVSEAAGIWRAYGAGLGVATGDYNQDGWPDLFVANDATPNQLWINKRDGTFADEGPLSGTAFNAAGNPEGSMGIASGDYDLDGDEDLFVTNIVGETFVLYENDGSGSFSDARTRTGLAVPTAAFTGFGTDWIDYDNDGWLDLFATNGAVNTIAAQRGEPVPYRMRDLLFRNVEGTRFEEMGTRAGPAFAIEGVGRGAAFGDLDNDGDVDMVVTSNGGPARLLLNMAGNRQHWVQVRLDQPSRNRFGVGATVAVERAGRPTLWRRVRTDGSYLSANDGRVHLGLGSSPHIDAIVVQWPDGERERWAEVATDEVLTLRRGTGTRR